MLKNNFKLGYSIFKKQLCCRLLCAKFSMFFSSVSDFFLSKTSEVLLPLLFLVTFRVLTALFLRKGTILIQSVSLLNAIYSLYNHSTGVSFL